MFHPSGALAQVPPTDNSAAVIADFLMSQCMNSLCLFAGKEAEVGATFLWRLCGDLEGSWIMRLRQGQRDVIPRGTTQLHTIDGTIDWRVSIRDLRDFFSGTYDFAKAAREGRFVFTGADENGRKLVRAVQAFAKLDIRAIFSDPQGYALKIRTATPMPS